MTQPDFTPELSEDDHAWMTRPYTDDELKAIVELGMPPAVAAGFVLRKRAREIAAKHSWDGIEITNLADLINVELGDRL